MSFNDGWKCDKNEGFCEMAEMGGFVRWRQNLAVLIDLELSTADCMTYSISGANQTLTGISPTSTPCCVMVSKRTEFKTCNTLIKFFRNGTEVSNTMSTVTIGRTQSRVKPKVYWSDKTFVGVC